MPPCENKLLVSSAAFEDAKRLVQERAKKMAEEAQKKGLVQVSKHYQW